MSETEDPYDQQPSYGRLPGSGRQPSYGSRSGRGVRPRARTTIGGPRRLSLSRPTKMVLASLVVLAAIAFGALFIASGKSSPNAVNNSIALRKVEVANNALTKNSQGFQSGVQACNGQLPCVTGFLRSQAKYLATFDTQIEGISLTGRAKTDAAGLVSADNAAVQALSQLAAAKTNTQYVNVVNTSSLTQDQRDAAAEYAKLVRDLGGATA